MTTTVEREHHEAQEKFDQVEELAALQAELSAKLTDDQAQRIRELRRGILRSIPPVRVTIASALLGLDPKTIRFWADKGVLRAAPTETTRRMVLDPERLHEVLHLVRDLRAAGRNRDLLNAVWFYLQDQELLDSEELRESLDQFRRGEVVRAY